MTESNSVNFEYTAVGSIMAVEKGGWINDTYQNPSAQKAFSSISKELNRIGANGIINLSISSSVEMTELKTYVSVITVKGMAIKIPDNKVKLEVVDTDALGYIDGIKCKLAKKYSNGTVISTSKELTPNQIKKAVERFLLKGKIMFNIEGHEDKGQAYAGVDEGYIIIYETNEFIKL